MDELYEIFGQCENCGSDIDHEEYNRTATTETCDACGHPEWCENCGKELESVEEEMHGFCGDCYE